MTEQKYYHLPLNYHALVDWHKSLYSNKGDRAELRRCATPDDVLLTKGFRTILQSSGRVNDFNEFELIALACAAGVLSHVKEHDENASSFARQMAKNKEGSDKPIVSELRLSRLQKSYSWEEFYRRLIRVIKMLDNKLNVLAIADAIFHWGKEFDGNYAPQPMNRLQVKWANEYYQVLLNDKSKEKIED